MINYKLDMYTEEGFKFVFNDGRYTVIDLAKNYKNYREPTWHFTVTNVDQNLVMFHKNIYKVGDILYFDRNVSTGGVVFKRQNNVN